MALPPDDRSHVAIIPQALRDLNRHQDWRSDEYRLLAGGLSGSAVYAIGLAGASVVLKLTPTTSAPEHLVHAQREALFYRYLSSDLPVVIPRLLAASTSAVIGVAILLAASEPASP